MSFNLRQIFSALNAADVDYVVVGGLAVILHGYLRATADLDLAIGLEPANAQRGMDALARIGLRPRMPGVTMGDFSDPMRREEWRQRGMLVFPLWDPLNPLRSVDVFVEMPLDFAALSREAVQKDLGGVEVCVASIPHLIAMKERAGRARDHEDIDKLRLLLTQESGKAR